MSPSSAQIESLLAGTQCRQCGYPGCAEYAQAIVDKGESINKCRPGGERVHQLLQQTMGQPSSGLFQQPLPSQLAVIEEKDCIGCTLCLQICPTGAIIGTSKHIHSISSNLCTGCGLCLPVCPVECITTVAAPPEHKLTQQQGDGSLTAAASAATWGLAHLHTQRQTSLQNRTQKVKTAAQPVELASISADVAAKIAAARQKALTKYSAKGPLKKPKYLKTK